MAWRVVFTRTPWSTHSRRAVHGMTVLSNPHLKLKEDEPLPGSRCTIRNRVTTSPTPIFCNLMRTQLLGSLTFVPIHVLGGGELPHLPTCGARALSLYFSAPGTERPIPPKSPWFAVRFEEDLWALCSLISLLSRGLTLMKALIKLCPGVPWWLSHLNIRLLILSQAMTSGSWD